MKKIIIPLVALAVAASMCSCAASGNQETKNEQEETVVSSQQETQGENMNIPNPWGDYVTLDEAAAAAGVSFTLPDEYRSDANIYRAMPGKMLEILVPDGDGVIRIRVTPVTDEDITGDYNVYELDPVEQINDVNVVVKSHNQGEANVAVWSDDTYTYAVLNADGMNRDDAFDMIGSIIISNTQAY